MVITRINTHLNKDDKLLKHSFFVFVAGIITGAFNYLFQIYMGRSLGPEGYGILGAVFSLFYIQSFAYKGIQAVVTKFIAMYTAQGSWGKIHALVMAFVKKVSLYGCIGLGIYILASHSIAQFLKIESTLPIILMGIAMFLSLYTPVFEGVLRGLQKFSWLSASQILSAAVKLIAGILLVSLGFSVAGAINSVTLSFVAGVAFLIIPLRFLFKHPQKKVHHREVVHYGIPVMLASVSLMLMSNIDVLLVKHYFSSIDAGFYTAASTLAKIIWFVTGTFVVVMFPKVSHLVEKGKDASRLLRITLLYTGLIAFPIIIMYFVTPGFVVSMLYGPEYKISNVIGIFSLAFGFFALNNVFAYYHLAHKKTASVILLAVALVVESIAIILFHASVIEVIKGIMVVNILLFIAYVIYSRKALGLHRLEVDNEF